MRRSRKELKEFARVLNDNLPKSEVWFWDKWRACAMAIPQDKPNTPKFGFIPDIYNRQHRYIIEIDGSVHDQEYIQYRDKLKDELFSNGGYLVVRVRAYCDKSFSECVELIRKRRLQVNIIGRARDRKAKKKELEIKKSENRARERALHKNRRSKNYVQNLRETQRIRAHKPLDSDIRDMKKRLEKKREREDRLKRQLEMAKGRKARFKFGQS